MCVPHRVEVLWREYRVPLGAGKNVCSIFPTNKVWTPPLYVYGIQKQVFGMIHFFPFWAST